MLLASCGPKGNSFRIRGEFRDMEAGELYIYNLSDNNARLDTLKIQEGNFLYRGQVEEVTPYILVFPNGMEQVLFVGPGEDLKYEASANDLKNYVVSGSEANKLMNAFLQETDAMNAAEISEVAQAYIKEHISSPVAIYLFDRYFVQDENANHEELARLLQVLRKQYPRNHFLLDIESKTKNTQRIQVGKKLPNVTLVQEDLKNKKLWATQKDYNIIVFWATWMPNGYDCLWKLRRCSDAYKEEKEKFRIVAVSLDVDRSRWEETIRADSANNIEHYCDGMSFESKAMKALGIDDAPCYVLTDKEHKILKSGNNISEVDTLLKKYLDTSPKDKIADKKDKQLKKK